MVRIALILLCAAVAAPGLSPARASDAGDVPATTFLDFEEQIRMQVTSDFSWLYQKPFVASVVEKVLLKRRFDPKSARYLAHSWDALRYHVETGAEIMPGDPLKLTGPEAVTFAHRIPSCYANISGNACKMKYSPEFGCRLESELATICQRNLKLLSHAFDKAYPQSPPTRGIYDDLACLVSPSRGGNVAVISSATVTSNANRLRGEAEKAADKIAIDGEDAGPAKQLAPRPDAPSCPKRSDQVSDTVRKERGWPIWAFHDGHFYVQRQMEAIHYNIRSGKSRAEILESHEKEKPLNSFGLDLEIAFEPKFRITVPPGIDIPDAIANPSDIVSLMALPDADRKPEPVSLPEPELPKTLLSDIGLRSVWATGSARNCGNPRRTYNLEIQPDELVWRDGLGNLDYERVVENTAYGFATVTRESRHVTKKNVPAGQSWNYGQPVRNGQRIVKLRVTPGGKPAFSIYRCR